MKSTRVILLAATLALTGCVPQQQYNQEVQQVQQLKYLNATDQQLNQSLQAEVNANQVQIRQLQTGSKSRWSTTFCSPEGGWELSEKGHRSLNKVVPALQGVTGKQIVIEGYTDDLPILAPLAARFPSNWDLSAARAISVVRYLVDQGIDPNQLSAVAFGKYHPIAPNDTPQGRQQNRRINIAIQDQSP